MAKDFMSAFFFSRLSRLCIALVFGLAFVCVLLGIAWLPRSGTSHVHAAGCPYLGFSPNSGHVGTTVTISGAISCIEGSNGEKVTISVIPGDNTSDPTICENPPTRVNVGTVTVVANQKSSLTFKWPRQAGQLGTWSACTSVTSISGATINSTWGASLFMVVAAPTPTHTPRPMPTNTAAPTAATATATTTTTALATATPPPLPTADNTAASTDSSQQPPTTSDRPLPWGLVLGGVGAVGGASLLALGGALVVRRRRLRV